MAGLGLTAAHAQSTSPEPYQMTGGWARAIFKAGEGGYRQQGPILFLSSTADCLGEAEKIQEAMVARTSPPGCRAQYCRPYYFVTCTRFVEGANGRIAQAKGGNQ